MRTDVTLDIDAETKIGINKVEMAESDFSDSFDSLQFKDGEFGQELHIHIDSQEQFTKLMAALADSRFFEEWKKEKTAVEFKE